MLLVYGEGEMQLRSQKAMQVNVSVDVALLAKLIESEQLCAADVTPLDREAHEAIRHVLLAVCARKLRGHAAACTQCAAQSFCQQSAQAGVATADLKQYSFSVH